MIERWFELTRHGTTARREVVGGVTTFVAMAHIVVLNPAILAHAGFPRGPSTVATILVAVVGTLLMALVANRPFAVAPYMGENAFLAFGLAALGVTWQERLGTVLITGLAFALLVALRTGPWLVRSIAPGLKHSFAAGIGFFLLFVGLNEAGLVKHGAGPVPVALGDLHDPRVLLAVGGFTLIAVLQTRGVPGALLLGMVTTAAAGAALGLAALPDSVFALPFAGNLSLDPIMGAADLSGVLRWHYLPVLLTLFLVSFLDTVGTLVGLGAAGEMLDAEGDFPGIERPMAVNALSCIFAALVGTSTSGAFLESAAGIREGARTGLAALVTAALFCGTLFVVPLLEPLQELGWIYAPPLIAVGVAMLPALRGVKLDDPTEAIPFAVTVAMMAFTYNIANGITAGLVLHPLLKLAAGRRTEVTSGGWVLCATCFLYYAFGLPH